MFDKVDLVIGPYGTNVIAATMPSLMQHNMATVGMMGLGANSQFHYAKYFSILPVGPDPETAFSAGFFDLVKAQSPKPTTFAIVGADAEFGKTATDGARENAQAAGLKIVYDQRYPPNTVDFAPIIRAIQAENPDVVFVGAYPPDTVGIVRAASEAGFEPKMFGGAMIGLTATVFKMQLGPLTNGYVVNEVFVPTPGFDFPGLQAVMKRYQAQAASSAPIRSAMALCPSAMRRAKCWARRSRKRRVSIPRRSPPISTPTRFPPWSATWRSVRTANGRSRASSSRNSSTSSATRSTSSATCPRKWWSGRRNTKPAP